MGIITGRDAKVWIASGGGAGTLNAHSIYAISDFSLTFDRGTVEQELLGETGNYYTIGALSVEGSYTNCRFAASGYAEDFYSVINAKNISVSGTTGSTLRWFFMSCMVTSIDVSLGDNDSITEASVDFTVMNPHEVYINSDCYVGDVW